MEAVKTPQELLSVLAPTDEALVAPSDLPNKLVIPEACALSDIFCGEVDLFILIN